MPRAKKPVRTLTPLQKTAPPAQQLGRRLKNLSGSPRLLGDLRFLLSLPDFPDWINDVVGLAAASVHKEAIREADAAPIAERLRIKTDEVARLLAPLLAILKFPRQMPISEIFSELRSLLDLAPDRARNYDILAKSMSRLPKALLSRARQLGMRDLLMPTELPTWKSVNSRIYLSVDFQDNTQIALPVVNIQLEVGAGNKTSVTTFDADSADLATLILALTRLKHRCDRVARTLQHSLTFVQPKIGTLQTSRHGG